MKLHNQVGRKRSMATLATALIACAVVVSACGSDDETDVSDVNGEVTDTTGDGGLSAGVDTSLFKDGSIESIETVACELSDGTTGECYEITTVGDALDTPIGPFCPTTLNTADADAGVWLDGTNLYQANGSFIADLPNIYGDGTDNDQWDLFEDDGN